MKLLNESAYLPNATAELPKGPWLVLAPHPDDESFGLGGTLLLAKEAQLSVDVLFLTDGRAADPNDTQLPEKREQEANTACKQLGINRVMFWREMDRELSASQHLIERLKTLIKENKYASVFFPAPQEPHPDHRVSSILAWESLRQLGFSASPISYEISVQAYTNQFIDITRVVSEKESIMACYDSQMSSNHYIARILGLNQSRAWSLPLSVSHAEALYIWEKQDRPLNAILLSIASQQAGGLALPQSLPLISVITRTQNRVNFLREAIRCVAAQSYQNIELIVVNDAGENCQQLVQEEAIGSIQHVQYHQLEVQVGRAQAANEGLQLAQGEYICFLDDDDLLEVDHLQQLMTVMQAQSRQVVYSGTKVIAVNQDGTVSDITEYNVGFSAQHLLYENYLPIHSVLFQSKLLANTIRFDTTFNYFEDWDFWIQLSQKADFTHSPAVTAIYRLHGNASGVHEKSEQEDPYLKIYRKWLEDYSTEQIFALIKRSHQWHSQAIDVIQDNNAAQLDVIGQKHSYALQIIQERDAQLHELNKKIQKLKVELQEKGDQHHYAITIIQQRDTQLQEANNQIQQLTDQHQHALDIIQQRDQQLEEIHSRKIMNRLKRL